LIYTTGHRGYDMKRTDHFKVAMSCWLKSLGIMDIIIRRDRRLKHFCSVEQYEDGKVIVYIGQKIKYAPIYAIYATIFHELNHIIRDLPYKTEDEKVRSECLAERYALRMLKRYYPKYYRQYVQYERKRLAKGELQKKHPIHYKAYNKIKEYKV